MNISHAFRRFLIFSVCSFAVLFCPSSQADVRLPGVFGDHMVIQQKMKIKVWGWADEGEAVTVTLGDQSATTKADDAGKWQVQLPSMTATNQPLILTVKGNNTIEIKDVLIGEVWLCSGQSNMEWPVSRSTNAAEEIAAADYPMIRHIKIPRAPSTKPLDDVKADWQVCSPEVVGSFTACGYFMARNLYNELDVPVGLVNSSWGGTRVEPWTPPVGFQNVEAIQDIYQSVVGRTPGTGPYRQRMAQHISATQKWLEDAVAAMKTDEEVSPSPEYPSELKPFTSHQDPTMLYNGMIHSLVGFPIRGAIWYQGESNHAEGMLYFEKKKALIDGWRKLWGQGDFPFYYVQIAPYQYGSEDSTILAKFWEAQAAVQKLPNSGMVVINDIATLNDIHPPNKQDVGHRLALLALKNDYGRKGIVATSPEVASLRPDGRSLVVTFRNTGGGLKTRDGKPPSHFEVIGPGSGGFQPAVAKIEGNSVVLASQEAEEPVAFRFAWDKLAEPNLTGGTGLPVGACRGGELPEFLDTLPLGKEYKLVYDLDLSKLGSDIRYDVDNSGSIEAFDRIGYLVELTTAGGDDQKVFVTMNAFTDDVKKIGIPTVSSQAKFQQKVEAMDVFSSAAGVTNGTSLATGNMEFWPNNYGVGNGANVPGASASVYDFGDDPAAPGEGYGSMQIHNFAARETIFAISHWSVGAAADLGIGNSTGDTRDWTFTGNAASYTSKRLRVYVRGK